MGFQTEGDNFELWILKWKGEIKYDYVENKPVMHGLLDQSAKKLPVGPIKIDTPGVLKRWRFQQTEFGHGF